MNVPDRPFVNIVVPDLFGRPGGIARICRSLCLAAARYCEQAGIHLSVLVLSDEGYTRDSRYLPDTAEYLYFSGDRAALAIEVLRRGHAHHHLATIFGHVNLASLANLFPLKRGERTRRYAVVAHGIEVWTRLPLHRRRALSLAREIWSVSAFTARQIEDVQRVPDGNLRVIHNGLDPFFDATSVGQATSSAPESPFILSVSRLSHGEEYKGIDTAIRAIAHLVDSAPSISLKIVGSGDDQPRLARLAQSMDVDDHVDFLGPVPDDDLMALYRDCAFFTLPSKKEGFGLVYLEAMARSRAVVACDAGGSPEVVVPNATGLLVPFGDDARLAHAFGELWRSPELAARMGSEGLRRVDQRFRFAHYAQRVADGMDRLINTSGQKPVTASAQSSR